jgi:hypothetical protein
MDSPPVQITRANYDPWLKAAVGSTYVPSGFYDIMFDWYEAQLKDPVPPGVNADPEKLYVVTDIALQQTIQLENGGEIERGNTIGFDVYGIVKVPTPGLHTASDNHFSMTMMKSAPNGETEFRQSLRRSGQSYEMLGLEFARKSYAFNASRVRTAEKGFIASAVELRDTGHIKS